MDTKSVSVFLWGAVVLIAMPILGILCLFTVLLLPVGIILMILYGIFIYLSKVVVVFYIQKKFLSSMNKTLSFLFLSFGILLIFMIPIFGGLVKFAVVLFGLGVVLLYLIEKYRNQDGKEDGSVKVAAEVKALKE